MNAFPSFDTGFVIDAFAIHLSKIKFVIVPQPKKNNRRKKRMILLQNDLFL